MSEKGFGQRLKDAIGDESVNAFAKRCEIGESSIRNYLNDKFPGADTALKIADTANVSLEWLIAGRGDKMKSQPTQQQSHSFALAKIDEAAVSATLDEIEQLLHAATVLPPEGELARRKHELVEIAMNNAMSDILRRRADMMLSIGFRDKDADRRAEQRKQRFDTLREFKLAEIEEAGAEFQKTVSPHFKAALSYIAVEYNIDSKDLKGILSAAHILTYEAIGRISLGWKPELPVEG